jgi:hypothetical protein
MDLPSVDRVLNGAVTPAPIDFAAKDHGFTSMRSGARKINIDRTGLNEGLQARFVIIPRRSGNAAGPWVFYRVEEPEHKNSRIDDPMSGCRRCSEIRKDE